LGVAAAAGGGLVVLAGLIGVVYALRRVPSPAVVRAVIDRRASAGGLVMASDEMDIGAWSGRVPTAGSPVVRYRNPRAWWMLVLGLAFVGVAFGVPDRYTQPAQASKLDVSGKTEQLARQIEVLEQEQAIESDEAAAMRDKLDRIERQASGSDPAKTFESLDHMQERLNKTAELAAESATGAAEQLTEAEALGEALQETVGEMSPQQAADAMGQLADMLQQAKAGNQQFAQALDEKTLEQIKAGARPEAHFDLDVERAQELADLAEQMNELKDKLAGGDANDLSPADAAKMAQLRKKLSELSAGERKQLEALAEAAQQMAELDVNAIAEVDVAGVAEFYVPDGALELDDVKDANAAKRYAARLGGERPLFRGVDQNKVFKLPKQAFNGEAVALTRDEKGKLTIYGYKPSFNLEWSGIDELEGTHIVATGGGEAARVYGPDEGGSFKPGAMGGACKVCRAVKANQMRALQRMNKAGLIKPGQLNNARQMGRLNDEAIESLKKRLAQGQPAKQAAAMACGRPGRGGITRGRGDAPMTWKDPTTDDGAQFKAQTLPPASMAQLKDARSLGVSLGAPEEADPASTSTGGALSGRETGDSSAQTHKVLPRHRGAVRRYFERK
jgi:hypothetical protein